MDARQIKATAREFDRMAAFRVHESRLVEIRKSIEELKSARLRLRSVDCANAADYVARALKSVEGAERHARNLMFRD
jgi:hypothetical protein